MFPLFMFVFSISHTFGQVSEEQEEEIRKMLNAGHGVKKIAREVGCYRQAVQNAKHALSLKEAETIDQMQKKEEQMMLEVTPQHNSQSSSMTQLFQATSASLRDAEEIAQEVLGKRSCC